MQILIIGSKGFIGSHAYHYFKNNATYKTWACDVVADYVDERYFTIESSNSDFNELFEKIPFDVCINCSGAASVPGSLKNPLRDFSLNTLNVIKVLEAIRRYAPNCNFINMSSAAVYGNPQTLPIQEISIINSISPYGQHKYFAEEICKEYHNFFGIKTSSLRIFSAYGPGLMKQLFWDWYQKSKDSSLVNIYGIGNESRDFIYIDDLVRVIELAINNADFNGSSVNVANGKEVFINEIASIFFDILNKKYVFTGEIINGNPINWVADISKIQKWGYHPKISIGDGIKKYIQWIKGLN